MSTKPNTSQITYDTGSNKQDLNNILDTVVPVADYTALRAYTGRATTVRITTPGIAGFFRRNGSVADNGGTAIVDGSGRSWERVFDGDLRVVWFGADKTGSNVSSTAFQSAIDLLSAGNGGTVIVDSGIYKANFVLKSGVTIKSSGIAGINWSKKPVHIVAANAGGAVIDTPDAEVLFTGIDGLSVSGHASGSDNGIRFRNVKFSSVYNVSVTDTNNEGFIIEAGTACDIRKLIVTDALKNRARATRTGAVKILGFDHMCYNIEAQVGNQNFGDRQSSASRNLVGLYVGGANNFLTSCIGELSDIGIFVEGASHSLVACRADLNNGEGFYVAGEAQLIGCRALNNSKGLDAAGVSISGVYSSVYASGRGSHFINMRAVKTGPDFTKHCFEDVSEFAGMAAKNIWTACEGDGFSVSKWKIPTSNPPRISVTGGVKSVTLAAGANEVDADSVSIIFITEAPASASITRLLNGVTNQEVTLVVSAPTQTVALENTWFSGDGGFRTNSEPANKTLAHKRAYKFIKTGLFWSEV